MFYHDTMHHFVHLFFAIVAQHKRLADDVVDQALMERQRTDEVARRVTSYLETEDGGLLKRRNRIGKYRDE